MNGAVAGWEYGASRTGSARESGVAGWASGSYLSVRRPVSDCSSHAMCSP